jgi:hypothetical protein
MSVIQQFTKVIGLIKHERYQALKDILSNKKLSPIRILLYKGKDTDVVEYAMSGQLSPALISEYTLALPDKKLLQQKLHEFYELWKEKEDSV